MPTPSSCRPVTNETKDTKGNRVLIIDQDSVRRGMVALTMGESEFQLEFANSPETGLDLLRALEPDVVIVGKDTAPADICQRIRAQQAGSSCLVVLMDESFEDKREGEAQAEGSGADTYIPFPFERRLLEQRLAAGQLRRKLQIQAELRPPSAEENRQETGQVPKLDIGDGTDPWKMFQVEVARLYDQLEALDYYQLLDMELEASSKEIKDGYFDLALKYHPDRFILHDDDQLKHEVYEVYKRLSEAFMVLIDPVSRRHYDAMLQTERQEGNLRYQRKESKMIAGEKKTAIAETPLGRRFLYFALRASEEGKLRTAHSYISLAIKQEPNNDALREKLREVEKRLEQVK